MVPGEIRKEYEEAVAKVINRMTQPKALFLYLDSSLTNFASLKKRSIKNMKQGYL